MRRPRLFEEIVAQIRGRIEDGTFPEGTTLPSEKELCRIFRVSRPTVKQALSVLGQLGVLQVRMGREGGYYVSTPNIDDVSAPLELLLSLRQTFVVDMMEVRLGVEGLCALLAAIRRDEDDLTKLRTAVEQMQASVRTDLEGFSKAYSDFYLALGEACKNPVLQRIMESLRSAVAKPIAESLRIPEFAWYGCMSHQRILAAIEKQDPQEAIRAKVSSIGYLFEGLERGADEDQVKRLDAAVAAVRALSEPPRPEKPAR